MAEKRQIITRNEQGEVSPPHRASKIAGGVRFDSADDHVAPAARAKSSQRGMAHRGLQVERQFKRAAKSNKRVILDI